MSTKTQSRALSLPADYIALVREFPLRPIRTQRDYKAATAIVDRLAVRQEGTLSRGEQDYLDTLTLLIEAYDDEHFKIKTRAMEPVDVLKYLMEQSGMKTADLGRLLDNRGLASLILNGHRALSKTHIRILSDYFKVGPGLFLGGMAGE